MKEDVTELIYSINRVALDKFKKQRDSKVMSPEEYAYWKGYFEAIKVIDKAIKKEIK